MRRFCTYLLSAGLILLQSSDCSTYGNDNQPAKSSPRESVRLVVSPDGGPGELVGPNERLQMLTLVTDADGKTQDLTRVAKYLAQPEGIVQIDSQGRVKPLRQWTS